MSPLPIFPKQYKVFTTKAVGKIRIKEHAQYNHVDAARVTVKSGVKVRLYGQLQDLVLEKGALVYLHGSAGQITNKGGAIYVFPAHVPEEPKLKQAGTI